MKIMKLLQSKKQANRGAAKQPVASKPQTEIRRGRQTKPFSDCLLEPDKEQHLKQIHRIAGGKQGKSIALIITACIKLGWITKPTFSQIENEFGNIGNRSGYNKYVNNTSNFTDDEIKGMKTALLKSIE
jgi:hypothetical protein